MTPHQKIVHAVTDYDRRQSKRKDYNRFAFAQYLEAAGRVEKYVALDVPLRTAVIGCFVGRLADKVLKSLDLEKMTDNEAKYGNIPQLPELE